MFFDNSQFFEFEKELVSPNGTRVEIYKLNHEILTEESLNDWALGLRNNYVEESLLERLISGTGLTKEEYLRKFIFPDYKASLGPSTMSGEFGELLFLDYVNFVLKYYVTRTKYFSKINPSNPLNGTDVIAYKMQNILKPSINDQLIAGEVKTRSNKYLVKMTLDDNPLRDAITDSEKDRIRIGESLNAEKRRLLDRNRDNEAKIVERFQNKTDNPFVMNFYAVAVLDSRHYSEEFFSEVINQKEDSDKKILIIYSSELLDFLKDIYRRAFKC